MFDLQDDFNVNNLVKALNGMSYEAITLSRKALVSNLQRGDFSSLVVFGIGSGGLTDSFFHAEVHWTVKTWVSKGGKFIIHGEGGGRGDRPDEKRVMNVCKSWFDRDWTMTGDFYRRTDHNINFSCTELPPSVFASLPSEINVKACMLSNVPTNEKLFAKAIGAQVYSLVALPGLFLLISCTIQIHYCYNYIS